MPCSGLLVQYISFGLVAAIPAITALPCLPNPSSAKSSTSVHPLCSHPLNSWTSRPSTSTTATAGCSYPATPDVDPCQLPQYHAINQSPLLVPLHSGWSLQADYPKEASVPQLYAVRNMSPRCGPPCLMHSKPLLHSTSYTPANRPSLTQQAPTAQHLISTG